MEQLWLQTFLKTGPCCSAGLPLPSSSTCCTQLYRQPLPNRLLRKILHVELQEANGDCYLQAIV